jgi:uncharacterized protein involved in response to NO
VSTSRFVPFDYGFRPFFLAAGLYAVVAIGAWAWILASGRAPFGGLPPHLWHGHEMLFGFIGAAIAGFLLTAVPSWTGSRGFAGAPLVLLSGLWLAGRIAFAGAAFLPWALVAAAELAFLPLLAFLIGRSLIRERNRNFPMLVIVSVLWGIDAWCLGALAAADFGQAGLALRTGIGVAAMMIMAVMTRASLGHTGRPLIVAGSIAVAYALLLVSALVRVFGPALVPASYLGTIEAAALLWIAAFAVYVVVYAPILTTKRADGKPG